jgi:uncharacterized protein (DUF58 family)
MGNLKVDYASAIAQFEKAIKKFKIKNVIYQTIFRGKGLEFDSYRNFSPDEDSSMIDWKASLRANDLLAKQYVEERDLNIYFVLDVSNSMLFGSGKQLKAEFAAEIVLVLSHLIINSGDNAGLILFNDHSVKVLPPSKSKNQFSMILKFLSDSEMYGGHFDFDGMLDFTLKFLKSPYSIVVLLSDFIHVKKDFERNLRLLSTRFETMGIMIRDSFDDSLPKVDYQLVVQDPYSGRQMVLDPRIAGVRYAENAARQKRTIKELFTKSNVDLLELNSSESFVFPLASFLNSRAKGVRD